MQAFPNQQLSYEYNTTKNASNSTLHFLPFQFHDQMESTHIQTIFKLQTKWFKKKIF